MNFITEYLNEALSIIEKIDKASIEKMVDGIVNVRKRNGRLFFVGCGGGAGHASHAVNDFRKIAGIESYAPTDNVSELTARINDDGWETSLANWLKGSKINSNDGLFIFSVGGGNLDKNISVNLVNCLKLAQEVRADIFGIVGRDGGYTAKVATACVVIPNVNPHNVTAHTEAFQAVVWHLIVGHPRILKNEMKWESVPLG